MKKLVSKNEILIVCIYRVCPIFSRVTHQKVFDRKHRHGPRKRAWKLFFCLDWYWVRWMAQKKFRFFFRSNAQMTSEKTYKTSGLWAELIYFIQRVRLVVVWSNLLLWHSPNFHLGGILKNSYSYINTQFHHFICS